MTTATREFVLRATGAPAVTGTQVLQELWSGYGTIERVGLRGAGVRSVVLKHVRLPARARHPRGWATALGHDRKVHSYQVEAHFYRTYAQRSTARLPTCLAVEQAGDDVLLLLEDLDAAGFPARKMSIRWADIVACLRWLARFHASYLAVAPEGLWPVGTYWHLATRPQELAALDDERLREAAPLIDTKLSACAYQTLVHGDAKLANFCFAAEEATAGYTAAGGAASGEPVAGLDFQYVGGGCGVKDVAYFIGSCLDERACERRESQILDTYFGALREALGAENANPQASDMNADDVEAEWRPLYRVAWADFHRFLKGWSPGHWKLTDYSGRVTAEVIESL